MPRPQSFWDVIANTADYASEAIPEWQRQKGLVARQGLIDRRYEDERAATAGYRNQTLGLQRERFEWEKNKPEKHVTEHPSFDVALTDMMLHPEKYDPKVIADFKEADHERRASKAEPKQPPDFLGLGRTALQSATDRWRAGKANRVVGSEDGHAVYGPDPYFNEPEPTWITPGAGGGPSIIQAERSLAEKWGQDPDALEYQLTGKYPNAAGLLKRLGVTNVPRLNYGPSAQPSRGITPQRSEAGMGAVGQQRQRRQFGDGSVAELNPVTGKWEVVQ